MKKSSGILCAFASALIFGFTPILAKLAYAGGSNGVTMTFLRALLAIPLLFFLIRRARISIRLSRSEWKSLLLVGSFGPCATTLLLYSSYEYIPIGVATMLHFMYPVIVALAGVFFFKERLNRRKVAALLAAACGAILFFESGAVQAQGIILALFSGVTYSFYMLGLEHSSLNGMYYFKLSFYFCVLSAIISGVFGAVTGTLRLDLTPKAWFYSFAVSIFVSVGAITLFQTAVVLVGSFTTAILSTLEPITSVLLGWLFLSEGMTLPRFLGCICILFSVCITTFSQLHSSGSNHTAVSSGSKDG
jgi:drug/metabolite transporter (DMT)-like permease